jgi:hypothetical protein
VFKNGHNAGGDVLLYTRDIINFVMVEDEIVVLESVGQINEIALDMKLSLFIVCQIWKMFANNVTMMYQSLMRYIFKLWSFKLYYIWNHTT